MPITADLELQAGKEATNAWGTAVAPTVKLMGINDIDLNPIVDVQQVEDLRGTRVPAHQSLVHMVGGEASISGLLSYDDFPYWLEGLFGRADTDSSVKILFSTDVGQATRVYCAPTESSDTEDAISYTLAEGDGTNIYALNGASVNTINLTGESAAPLEISVEFIGKNVTTDTFGTATDRVVTYAMGDHARLYIGKSTDAVGTASNATSDIGFSFDLTINANREVKRKLNDLTPTAFRDAKWSGTLGLSLEMTTVTEAYLDDIVSATKEGKAMNVRIAYNTGSSDYINLDFCGIWSGDPDPFTDVDGIVGVDLEMLGQKDATSSDWFAVTVRNHVAVLA